MGFVQMGLQALPMDYCQLSKYLNQSYQDMGKFLMTDSPALMHNKRYFFHIHKRPTGRYINKCHFHF
jgi:hypothetical protein